MSESERVVCLGDSITEGLGDERGLGWVGRLALYLAGECPSKWHINNLGVAGDTSIDIKLRLMTECLPRYPVRLILSAGINDTTSRVWPAETGSKVDITYARDIWRQILGVVKTNNIKTLVLGLTPVNEALLPLSYMPYDETDRGHHAHNTLIEKYEVMLGQEVKELGFPFLPLFQKLSCTGYAENLPDGIHPNAKGYDILFKAVKEKIEDISFFLRP
ncbi:MAG: hypothetical protein EOM37_04900 [Proteobacteria bacterium]|jgi:lysophospholipase L1-like esterase|nr:GDSL-type esterase/lipase family protein [Alphaproteobacteria bacterium]NCC03371.1 hypothetical protein [Pseudomonadota bacterium]